MRASLSDCAGPDFNWVLSSYIRRRRPREAGLTAGSATVSPEKGVRVRSRASRASLLCGMRFAWLLSSFFFLLIGRGWRCWQGLFRERRWFSAFAGRDARAHPPREKPGARRWADLLVRVRACWSGDHGPKPRGWGITNSYEMALGLLDQPAHRRARFYGNLGVIHRPRRAARCASNKFGFAAAELLASARCRCCSPLLFSDRRGKAHVTGFSSPRTWIEFLIFVHS